MDTTTVFSEVGNQGYLDPMSFYGNRPASLITEFSIKTQTGLDQLKSLSAKTIFDHSVQVAQKAECAIVEGDPLDATAPAAYTSFFYEPADLGKSFRNTITLRSKVGDVPISHENKTLSRYHEEGHLEQWNSVIDLQASPYSNVWDGILCAEDWAIAAVLTEWDAYPKGTLKAHVNGTSSIRSATKGSLISVERLEKLCAQSPNLQAALDKAGNEALSKIRGTPGRPNDTFLDFYALAAKDEYTRKGRLSDEGIRKYGKPTFVRLGANARKIGETLGIKGFRDDFEGLCAEIASRFPPEVKEWIKQENKRWGIQNKYDLPTTEQLVVQRGFTEQSFWAHVRKYQWKPPEEKSQSEAVPSPVAA